MRKIKKGIALLAALVLCVTPLQEVHAGTLASNEKTIRLNKTITDEVYAVDLDTSIPDVYVVNVPGDGTLYVSAKAEGGKCYVDVESADSTKSSYNMSGVISNKINTVKMDVLAGDFKIYVNPVDECTRVKYSLKAQFKPKVYPEGYTFKVGTVTRNGKKVRAIQFTRVDDSAGVLKLQSPILNNGKTFSLAKGGSKKTVLLSKTGHGNATVKLQKVVTSGGSTFKSAVVNSTFKF